MISPRAQTLRAAGTDLTFWHEIASNDRAHLPGRYSGLCL